MELCELLALNGMERYSEYEDARCYLADDMLEYNKAVNLTAIRDTEGVYLRHIIDSLTVEKHIPQNASLIDIGCGGGFPSLPLAIVREDVTVTSLDSTLKKLKFIENHASSVGLKNITTLCERAEALGKNPKSRESYDVVTARGVCEMRMLCELCLPLTKKSGKFIAMKNGECEDELRAADKAVKELGGEIAEIETVTLTNGTEEIKHAVIIIQKITQTPITYPRDWARISKKPL